jgi:spore coat protein A
MTIDPLGLSRRKFLRHVSALGVTAAANRPWAAAQMSHGAMQMPAAGTGQGSAQVIPPILRTAELAPFVDPLPLPQLAEPVHEHGVQKLRISMREIHAKLHRDLPAARMWSYGDTAVAPLIEARSGHALHVEWVNNLPTQHFFPIDHTLHGCGREIPDVRANVHLHGGRTPSKDDGQPEDWYVPGTSRGCTYPLKQDATALWYHDHAMGLNRLNIYAGLFGMALVRDEIEEAMHLPSGEYEVPLMIYDRMITMDGQLFYPDSGDPEHPWVSEFGGDSILINGKIFPYLEVEPRLYRFRLLNAANSRFFNLALSDGRPFQQIGSDQGLLASPVKLPKLLIAPSERADLLIDFSGAAGKNVHLVSGYTSILEFRVANSPAAATPARDIPATLRPVVRTPEASASVTRTITLDEYDNKHGDSMLMLLNGKRWHDPVTETPRLGATEIWEFINLTEDTHPMHLHLVRFQILDRRVFDTFAYHTKKEVRYLGDPIPPEANELGWKDVAQCPPTMVTRIIATFDGYPGKYLYHCHILEHEANDMMRPFEVVA